MITQDRTSTWFLVQRSNDSAVIQEVPITNSPFRIGRSPELPLCLAQKTVSTVHAEILINAGELWLHDLHSTNGTFVNGTQIGRPTLLHNGDYVQFAEVTFQLSRKLQNISSQTHLGSVAQCDNVLSMIQFDKLMKDRAVEPHFQPIVSLPTQEVVGSEVLGRSRLLGLTSAKELFQTATQLNLEEELSQMMRQAGLAKAAANELCPNLFLNTHPAEIGTEGLLQSLRSLRESNSVQSITLEVHEAAVTDSAVMKALQNTANDLDIRIAYDDFGAGQSRLVTLHSVRPDFVKFDISLIHEIDKAAEPQRRMVAYLVQMVRDRGIIALAEGVEREEEHSVLCELGFDLGQGFYYGKPSSTPTSSLVPSQRRADV